MCEAWILMFIRVQTLNWFLGIHSRDFLSFTVLVTMVSPDQYLNGNWLGYDMDLTDLNVWDLGLDMTSLNILTFVLTWLTNLNKSYCCSWQPLNKCWALKCTFVSSIVSTCWHPKCMKPMKGYQLYCICFILLLPLQLLIGVFWTSKGENLYYIGR